MTPGFFTPAWTPAWTTALINHLWQSTAVVLVGWLLTLSLRPNPARVRYAIWMIASIKFLVPFALLTSLGARWARPDPIPQVGPSLYVIVEEIGQPFRHARIPDPGAAVVTLPSDSSHIISMLFAAAWICGFLAMLVTWIVRWRRAAGMARSARPVTDGREFDALRLAERNAEIKEPIALVFSPGEVEPGIFGAIRPVLLWPIGLSERLDDAQIEAIMSHEVEHVCRRDNMSAAIHALVEALFWFHPLVRWMSVKLNEERERACDESVLERSTRPETYADSILKVCAFCLEPPTPCISGVSGADLKIRILRIMTRRSGVALSSGRKFLLSTAAALILAAPIGFGVLHGQSGPSSAETSLQSPASTPALPKYDVATIKPSSSSDGRRTMMMTPDGTSMHGAQVQMLLQQAFGVESDRILGAPAWVKSNQYDIEAKVPPEDAPKMEKLKAEQRREMLLPLLEERFNLKYHHETRELPTYALVVAKGGPKLTESKPGSPIPPRDASNANARPDGPPKDPIGNRGMMMMNPGRLEAHGGGMFFLSHALSAVVGRTVTDKTGLTGTYDFTLQWTPDEMAMPMAGAGGEGGPPKGDMPADVGGPTLLTAIEEQLGLKLESQKGTVDVIVIDHIDTPSEN
jgi:uncharacterized protein (TIGR03435 family)